MNLESFLGLATLLNTWKSKNLMYANDHLAFFCKLLRCIPQGQELHHSQCPSCCDAWRQAVIRDKALKATHHKCSEQMRAPRPKGAHQPRPRTAKATSSAPQQMLWWPKHCWQGLQVAASELKGRKNLFEPNTPKFENEIEPSATLSAMSMTMFQKRQNCTAQKKNTLWHSQCLNPQWKTGHANDQGSVSTSH